MIDAEYQGAIPMDPDDVFKVISNKRRRAVILSVDRSDDPVPAGDLAVEIAAVENAIDPGQVTGKQRSSVYVALIQSHLDLLDDCGAARYDERSKLVAPTSATAALARTIRQITTDCYTPDTHTDADTVPDADEWGDR